MVAFVCLYDPSRRLINCVGNFEFRFIFLYARSNMYILTGYKRVIL